MDKLTLNLHFKLMSLTFRFRDLFFPPENILEEVGIKPGYYILDYGCGPGSYSIAAAKMVRSKGKVYALDINPLAIKKVKSIASKKNLTNIKTIHSDYATGLSDESIDLVLLYDTLHELKEQDNVLEELHRVLKPEGILSLSDHHIKEDEIIPKITNKGLFRLARKDKRTYNFLKVA